MSKTTSLLNDESLPNSIEELEEQLKEISKRQSFCAEQVKELMSKENPSKGLFFASEIHQNIQLKMLLQYQFDLRKAKINRLRMGVEE